MCLKEIDNIIQEWSSKGSSRERADYILEKCDRDFGARALIGDAQDQGEDSYLTLCGENKKRLDKAIAERGENEAPRILHHVWAGDDGEKAPAAKGKFDGLRVLWVSDSKILSGGKRFENQQPDGLLVMPIALPLNLFEKKHRRLGKTIRQIVILELLKRNYVNASDILRLVVLWAYGGAYSDIADGNFVGHCKKEIWKFSKDLERKLKIHIHRVGGETRFANDVFVSARHERTLVETLNDLSERYRRPYRESQGIAKAGWGVLAHYFDYTMNTTGPSLMKDKLVGYLDLQKLGELSWKIDTGSEWAKLGLRERAEDNRNLDLLFGERNTSDELLLRGLLYVILDWTRIYSRVEEPCGSESCEGKVGSPYWVCEACGEQLTEEKRLEQVDFRTGGYLKETEGVKSVWQCHTWNDHLFSFELNYTPFSTTVLECVSKGLSPQVSLESFWEVVVRGLVADGWIDLWRVKGKTPKASPDLKCLWMLGKSREKPWIFDGSYRDLREEPLLSRQPGGLRHPIGHGLWLWLVEWVKPRGKDRKRYVEVFRELCINRKVLPPAELEECAETLGIRPGSRLNVAEKKKEVGDWLLRKLEVLRRRRTKDAEELRRQVAGLVS